MCVVILFFLPYAVSMNQIETCYGEKNEKEEIRKLSRMMARLIRVTPSLVNPTR